MVQCIDAPNAIRQNIYAMPKPDFQDDELTITKSEEKVKKPPLYKVVLHNDDYTTMEFVVFVLVTVFHQSEDEAFRIMLKVHNEGVGIAGVYTYEIAETKAQKTVELARQHEYPLLCTVEEE
jgi:ATP-dependent Clp protease adaptor protein ClpS